MYVLDCRDGLSTRPGAASEEIQLRIDPMDLDDELTGLHHQVRRLKHVSFRYFLGFKPLFHFVVAILLRMYAILKLYC